MNVNITPEEITRAKNADIVSLLERNGVEVTAKGRTSVCSSPFSSDSNPSFVIYSDQNRFHDFSTGKRGDIIDLASSLLGITFQESVKLLNGEEMPLWDEKKYEKRSKEKKPFDIANYTTGYEHEIKAIDDYARSRGITDNYLSGFFAKKEGEVWNRFPSIMFPHTDVSGDIIGAKFRNISDYLGDRFSSRGRLGFYTCDALSYLGHDRYIIEGEGNCNSLAEFFIANEVNARVISFGGVGQVPKEMPSERYLLDTYIIIDYDGDDKLYQERLKAYAHLNAKPIKLILPKGVDINSLWADGETEILKDLLL